RGVAVPACDGMPAVARLEIRRTTGRFRRFRWHNDASYRCAGRFNANGGSEVETSVQLRGSLASLALLFGAQSEALAQAAPAARPALEEIVVTARRRA